jgi:hypothetical protein
MRNLTPAVSETAAALCPRCQKPLIDPTGLGWCKGCGYCRSLAESEAKAAKAPAPAAPATTLTAAGSVICHTPSWLWVTLIGTALVAGATYALASWLTLSPLQRALLTSVQMAAGFALMFAGQFFGLLRIAPEESTLSFKDAVFPFRLYSLIFKRLPGTRHTVYLGAWGLAAIVSAAVFVGGLGHWFTYMPGHPKNQTQKTKSGRLPKESGEARSAKNESFAKR